MQLGEGPEVADYSIRLRILKVVTRDRPRPSAVGCRLLDPIADTESG